MNDMICLSEISITPEFYEEILFAVKPFAPVNETNARFQINERYYFDTQVFMGSFEFSPKGEFWQIKRVALKGMV